MLTQNELWFSHPFDLNDPFDLRPDLMYSISEIESDAFYQQMLKGILNEYSHLTSKEKKELVKRQWGKIKADPVCHYEKVWKDLMKRERYDLFGVLSTSLDCLNILTWDVYGDNHQGYAIGFNTLGLATQLRCTIGLVDYSDEPYKYSVFGKDIGREMLMYKKKYGLMSKNFALLL